LYASAFSRCFQLLTAVRSIPKFEEAQKIIRRASCADDSHIRFRSEDQVNNGPACQDLATREQLTIRNRPAKICEVRGCKHAGATCKLTSVPELPDIVAYISALEARIIGQPIEHVRLATPFLLRTVQPPLSRAEGRAVRELRRIGKRIAIGVDGDIWLVLHLMIAGRLHWRPPGAKLSGRQNLAAFDFPNGSLVLTEAGTKRRASLHVVSGEEGLRSVDPGGIEVFSSDLASFRDALTAENRTLKRALTDPRLVSGIGNAYSDEILHAAQLSPIALTHKLQPQEWEGLFAATRNTLELWIDRLRAEAGAGFPEKVTAFRKGMAVHGRYGEPCPKCGEKIQRIRYADNETNYCARCQTGGKVLADRGLSRLLGSDWPRTLEELEALKRR
jgi:formamidopyrimidine-DNA glycosylase